MRTTLDIEDDVLQAAKELATKEGKTAGRMLSELARKGLHANPAANPDENKPRVRNGIKMLPRRGEVVTLEHVQRIMDEEGI